MQHAGVSFTQWIGQSVVLQIVIDDLRVPVWGTILGETAETVRFETDDCFMDIEKSAIQAVVGRADAMKTGQLIAVNLGGVKIMDARAERKLRIQRAMMFVIGVTTVTLVLLAMLGLL